MRQYYSPNDKLKNFGIKRLKNLSTEIIIIFLSDLFFWPTKCMFIKLSKDREQQHSSLLVPRTNQSINYTVVNNLEEVGG